MQHRRLGRTELQVSAISLGAARGADDQPSQFIDVVHAALDAGVNLIDTAESYGESEMVLGEALRTHHHDDNNAILCTKYRPYDSHAADAKWIGSSTALKASVDASLQRLGRDHLDILLGHGIRSLDTLQRFTDDGCLDAMRELQTAGKVRHIGLSELSEADGRHAILRKAIPTGAFDVVMLTLNLLLQTAADSVLPLCTAADTGVIVMMPLNQASKSSGLVSKPAALECVKRHIAAGNLPDGPPYNQADLFDFLDPLSVPEAAIRYVLSHPVATCCVGMRTRERVATNLQALEQRDELPAAGLDDNRLSQARQLFGRIEAQER